MAVTVGIVGIVAALAALVWFVFGHGPFDEDDGDGREVGPSRGHFGPSGPG